MQTITPTVVADQLSLEFDWSALPEQKRYRVRDATRKIKECERAAGAAIFEMGMHLKEVRDELEHGQWEDWLEREYRRSHSDATRAIRVYEVFSQLDAAELIGSFAPMALYALVAGDSSLEACQEALDRAQAGDRIDNQLAQEIKSNTPGYRLIPDQQKLFGEQQRRRRSAPSEPPAPKFSEGDFAIITLSEYEDVAATITGKKPERHASQWMYEASFTDASGKRKSRTFYESALAFPDEYQESDDYGAQRTPRRNQPAQSEPEIDVKAIALEGRLQALEEELDLYAELLSSLYTNCSRLNPEYRALVLPGDLGDRIEELLHPE